MLYALILFLLTTIAAIILPHFCYDVICIVFYATHSVFQVFFKFCIVMLGRHFNKMSGEKQNQFYYSLLENSPYLYDSNAFVVSMFHTLLFSMYHLPS